MVVAGLAREAGFAINALTIDYNQRHRRELDAATAIAAKLGVTRHVLAARLKQLVEDGVLEKNAYSQKPLRYAYGLTEKGRDFAPALVGLKDWGKKHMPIRKPAAV